MATHSSTLAWKIPWTEEPGRLQSMGWRRVGHDWATSLSLFTFMHWRRKWQHTSAFLPGESQGRGSLVGWHLWGRTESGRTRLKRLSSSSNALIESYTLFVPAYLGHWAWLPLFFSSFTQISVSTNTEIFSFPSWHHRGSFPSHSEFSPPLWSDGPSGSQVMDFYLLIRL